MIECEEAKHKVDYKDIKSGFNLNTVLLDTLNQSLQSVDVVRKHNLGKFI